jgi:hypothetical protein
MKFLVFATAAMALVPRQTGPGDIIAADINAITDAVNALTDVVNSFESAAQADALISASQTVVAALKKGTDDADAIPPLTDEDLFPFIQQLVDLGPVVNTTVTTLLGKKQVFVDSGRGCEVYPQLVDQLSGTQAFNESLIAKTPSDLLIVAITIAQPVVDALNNGIAAFKDVECAATTTSAAASSTAPPTDTASSSAAATTTDASATDSASATASATDSASASATATGTITGSASATGTGSQGGVTKTVETDVTETVPCTTSTAEASGVTKTVETDITETVPCTTGSGAAPTTLVSQPSGAAGATGGSGSGSGSGNGSGNTPSAPGTSPTSPVIAGVSGKEIPFGVAVAAIMGVVAALL